ncbi:MAG: hypothetical protein HY529_03175 [Chloroflexi bacterium]|nr:hypothetical protein [Chloroflexota bacterium]
MASPTEAKVKVKRKARKPMMVVKAKPVKSNSKEDGEDKGKVEPASRPLTTSKEPKAVAPRYSEPVAGRRQPMMSRKVLRISQPTPRLR